MGLMACIVGAEKAEYNAQKAYEDVKTAYQYLQGTGLLDGFQPINEWPKDW